MISYLPYIVFLTFSAHVLALQQRQGGRRMPLAFSPPRSYGPSPPAALLETPLPTESEGSEKQLEAAGDMLESATSEAVASMQESLGNTTLPTVPEEKESKAREESSFLTDVLTPSAETFAAVNPAEKEAYITPAVSKACRQDFSQRCPRNFSLQNTLCIALDSYTGPCARVQKEFPVMTEEQKAAWARVCDADFPCVPASCSSLGRNYDEDCPVGWKLNAADGFCIENQPAPPSCVERIRGAATPMEKAAFERKCKSARWPCLSELFCSKKDYNAVCPQGWFLQAGSTTCTPPTTYTGACRSISSRDFGATGNKGNDLKGQKVRVELPVCSTEGKLLSGDTTRKTVDNFRQAKMAVEKKCSVSWPCEPQQVAEHRDYSAPCPLGWRHLQNNSCEAPPDFVETQQCPRNIGIESLAAKEAFSMMCHVEYPNKRRGRCNRDFSSRCPISWRDLGDGRRCRAPDDYDGRCRHFYQSYEAGRC